MIKVLISGCNGYIGSILTKNLLDQGHIVTGIDNFSSSHKSDLSDGIDFYEGCISDKALIKEITAKHKFDCVFHLASLISVEESTLDSEKYLENNFINSKIFIEELYQNGIKDIVFASTAAVYDSINMTDSIKEDTNLKPKSPYAESKLKVEDFLDNFQKNKDDFNYIILRLFNVSGSYQGLGEKHEPETHLIPCAVDALLNNQQFFIFGKDLGTPDGTALRDYIHVKDVVNSFIKSAALLIKNDVALINRKYNIGSAQTISNLEIIKRLEKISSKKLNYQITQSRAGDLICLKANNNNALKAGILNLDNSNIDQIIKDNLIFRTKRA